MSLSNNKHVHFASDVEVIRLYNSIKLSVTYRFIYIFSIIMCLHNNMFN